MMLELKKKHDVMDIFTIFKSYGTGTKSWWVLKPRITILDIVF